MLPVRWLAEDKFYPDDDSYMPVPDPDAEAMDIREWTGLQPGDAVAFDFRLLRGARGNESAERCRLFGEIVGDDARYVERLAVPPPFPGHGMQPGRDYG